ncbi:MAG: excinuclease ABC subunit UvrA [Clostridiales bacterium]|uniref:UvrABC system protein A n=1 Tax=Intestinimonas massiliensis (ex Afouda et al. 2020) TaxID=1673721 RepID=A0ABS9M4Q5_9FIRM|nr:excinuclease ABC subunit UvrA [Intestinimonas massiliensis (ex Afouda et al. 2020)]MCG4525777.1 excinuclease ABC subunit UvrA [Intestinimonas massiliensis (ex Afouda et al. 2020)]MCQ4805833.1 excinuclease ABC subunit UvrA [Intestinimonas massiliensis (ex Afouda et al. 2020)]MDU1323884.1 excinuclease ABC subunit UvrA [Clostridiales bacterium]
MLDHISVKGARANNLKNIDVTIPRDKLVVLTGLSGSGKSSLAFDTIYAEGQRRYVESLSSYARMFLGQMEKPDVDYIDGLSPAISIDQKTTSKNPRSTVGTVTEIYDYLRLLWARVGTPHCPKCGKEIRQQTVDQIIDQVMALPPATRIQVMAPVIRGKKGEHLKIFEDARKSGYVRVRADGSIYDLTEEIRLDKNKKHNIEVVVDRLVIKEDMARRLTDSVEIAANLSGGLVVVNIVGEDRDILFSQNYACEDCGISIEELSPRMFSFNNPFGACPTCTGLGAQLKVDPALIIPNPGLSILEGAITASGWNNVKSDSISRMYFEALAQKYKFKLNTPVKDLPPEVLDVILYGTKGEKLKLTYDRANGQGTLYQAFEGVVNNLERRYRETQSDGMRRELEECMTERPCPDCGGKRLRKEALAVTVGGISIYAFCQKPVTEALAFVDALELSPQKMLIAARILKEIKSRLGFLQSVGLQYLTLNRAAASLSGGESQRIRLATQIGSSLMGVLYILDEPSIGLHQRDNDKLLATLKHLRDLGNTLLVVEHDEDTMRQADYIVDIGPGAGVHGGQVVACGTAEEVMNTPGSITGDYLSGRKTIPVPAQRRAGNGHTLTIRGAAENNLRHVDVSIPLGTFTCVTGVSGSGKSSLINEILYKRLGADLNRVKVRPGKHDSIEGEEFLDKVINIDQSPIGRTPRSNPATYTGLFNDIRDLFATTADAKARGYGPGRFSFNVRGGRCEACAGDGLIKIEMHFLPDIYVPCEVCKGKRYNRETLEVRYKGKNIYEVLEMTVEEALGFFEHLPRLYNKLQTLYEVGLSYVKLGQPSTELSGGEAQRVKLATELAKRSTGKTIYILDEPTTGLHTADVHKLIEVLQKLVDAGNSVVVIEHNLDVIKTADHIIDLGPEGGDGGGGIVCTGTPEEVAQCSASYTGRYLKRML